MGLSSLRRAVVNKQTNANEKQARANEKKCCLKVTLLLMDKKIAPAQNTAETAIVKNETPILILLLISAK